VLSLNALRGSEHEGGLQARPIHLIPGGAALATSLWIATSALRPRGPLLEQATALLVRLLQDRLGSIGPKSKTR
jgi:LysR family nitrogen assimilation transcriptional regulator